MSPYGAGLIGIWLFLVASTLAQELPKRLDFVFDIDSTIVEYHGSMYNNESRWAAPHDLEVRGDYYEIVPGAPEAIQYLAGIPGARISFFSGGGKPRNFKLLHLYKLPNGKSALQVAMEPKGPARVFSRKDLVETSQAKLFPGEKEKNLNKIQGIDLDHAVLIDDRPDFAASGQERNLLSLPWDKGFARGPQTFRHLSKFTSPNWNPGSWIAENAQSIREYARLNRMVYAIGLIDLALEEMSKKGGSLADILWKKQNLKNPDSIERVGGRPAPSPHDLEVLADTMIYLRGARALKAQNPALPVDELAGTTGILEAISNFLKKGPCGR